MTLISKLVLMLGVVLAGCSRGNMDTVLSEGGPVSYEEKNVALLAGENNAFALDLFHRLSKNHVNIFFSPFSISETLAMTYEGARDDTRNQMQKVLGFSLEGGELHGAFYGLHEHLAEAGKNGDFKLTIATSLWPQKNYDFRKQYYSFLKKYYGVSITPLDFEHDLDNATKTINNWVEKKTNNRIQRLLGPKVLDERTRLVLVDAIWFKGLWARPFPISGTQDGSFYLSPTKRVFVAKMKLKSRFNFASTDEIQLIEFPYVGGKLSMLVILPKKLDGIGDVEKELTPDNLRDWQERMESKEVLVFMPKFKMTSMFRLGDALKSMGMTDAFDITRADFSGMNGKKDLYVSAVIHKAFINVDEQGTA